MRNLFLLIMVLFLASCGSGEIERLQAEKAALQLELEESKNMLEAARNQAELESARAKAAEQEALNTMVQLEICQSTK